MSTLRSWRPMKKQSAKGKARQDAWWAIRQEVLKRDGRKCRARVKGVCTRYANEVHHVVMRSAGGSDDPSNLIATCIECHDWIDAHKAEAFDLGLVHSPKHEAKQSSGRKPGSHAGESSKGSERA